MFGRCAAFGAMVLLRSVTRRVMQTALAAWRFELLLPLRMVVVTTRQLARQMTLVLLAPEGVLVLGPLHSSVHEWHVLLGLAWMQTVPMLVQWMVTTRYRW